MATFTVTTLVDENDAGASVVNPGGTGLSLREAIALANANPGADTITFAASLNGTIRLDGGDGAGGKVGGTLSITDAVSIEGEGRILISGDVNNDDTTVGATDITDIFNTAAGELDDNVQIISASANVGLGEIADLTLDGLTLTGGVTGGNGGAISSTDNVTLTNATVSGNSAGVSGGGIFALTADLTNSTVSGNRAGDTGGGIFTVIANLTDSTVSGNSAVGAGGGILAGVDAILTNSTVSGNSAGDDGGGILATTATLTNSTVSGNSAGDDAGGIFALVANLTNSTVSGNSAGDTGGGISVANADLTNSIVLGNDAASNDEVSAIRTTLTGGNIIGTDVFQGGTIVGTTDATEVFAQTVDIVPGAGIVLAGVLADNGGPVRTIALNTATTNPALDAGDDHATGVPTSDARGFSHDDFPGVANHFANISDLGAFEVSHEIVVTTLDDVAEAPDGVSLREAIALANANPGADTITFAANLNGTIRLDGGDGVGGTVGGTLVITEAVTINGDGRITISGDVADDDVSTGGTSDITDIVASRTANTLSDNVRIINATANLTLEGLTLTGGVATDRGGAVFGTTTVTLTNSTVSGNSAVDEGGGLYAGGIATITNSTVSGNSTGGDGGGIRASTANLTNSTVSGNTAVFTGGGIVADVANLTNSTVSGNSAGDTGGGISATTVNLTNTTVSGNSTQAGANGGGGIRANTANLTNSTVSGNSSGYEGGGMFVNTANLTNSTVSDNSAVQNGGGINATNIATLINSTVSGNSAVSAGGGIYAARAFLTNSTVSGNSAVEGGGINAFNETSLTNSIVLGNTAGTAPDIFGTPSLGGGNIVGDTFTINGASQQTSIAPADVFAAIDPITGGGQLAGNGGPVQTISLKNDASNPALDAGADGFAPALDARGFSRDDVAAVANNGANISDLGAFEASHEIVVTTLADVVDSTDGLTSLREAVALANSAAGADTITFAAGLNGTIRLTHVDGTLQVTEALTIDGDGRILITGDVANNDTTVGATDITDIAASTTGATLADNVQIINATAGLTLNGLTLTGGVTSGDGGAVLGTSVTLTNSTVSGNSATFEGGGIFAGTTAAVTNSTVSGNSAAIVGGGIKAATVTLTDSTISGNRADLAGGGIRADIVIVTNSTISGNSTQLGGSGAGGGIAADDVDLINSTISGNSADNGGGIVVTGTATFANSIVLGNHAEVRFDEVSGIFARIGVNIVGVGADTDGSDGIINANPTDVFAQTIDIGGGVLAGVLADNGGPVQTIALKASATNPALDASDSSAPTTDARGEARFDRGDVANGFGAGNFADLGAYELQNTAPSVTTSAGPVTAPEQVQTVIDSAITLVDDSATLASVTVSIAAGLVSGEDVLSFTNSGSITGSYNAATGVLTLTSATATAAEFEAALRTVTYTNTSDTPNTGARTITFFVDDGALTGSATRTVSVTAVDDAPVAGDDAFTTVDDVSKFAGSLLGNDSDVDSSLTVSAVNGSAAAVGTTITLASDALLTMQADGTFVFDPYGKYDQLPVGTTATETFTYTVSDGLHTATATVTLTVTGADNNDTFLGTSGPDTIDGGVGNDTIRGLGGDDRLVGGFGDDSLDGGAGNDRLFGDGGKDHLVGGAGDDYLDGGTNDDVIEGNAGNDRLIGGANNDTLIGGSGKDRLQGDAGQDRLEGGAGNDILDGGTNKDTLIGGTGVDRLTGGASADTFVFTSISDSAPNVDGHSGGVYSAAKGLGLRDIILDFAAGLDKIDVSAIDADTHKSGNQVFTWIGTDEFSGAGAELRFSKFNPAGTASDRTIVYGDVDGDGKAEFQIELRGLKGLTASDFHV